MSGGSGIQLRTDQVATILSSVLAATPSATNAIGQPTVTATSSANAASAGLHTSGELVGVACGVGLPLLFALVALLILYRREKQKHAPPKLMYRLPDDHKADEFTFRPPTATAASRKSAYTTTTADFGPPSDRGSFRTVGSNQNTPRVPGFAERYESMQQAGHAHEKEAREKQRHELDSSAIRDMIRHELGEGRVSR
ncbi:hypothetical protein LTR86_001523 [Recurvomyces mirabilis]|nr:hypothetical protein LTR86_001523 [Recurvomyces mirabilis]